MTQSERIRRRKMYARRRKILVAIVALCIVGLLLLLVSLLRLFAEPASAKPESSSPSSSVESSVETTPPTTAPTSPVPAIPAVNSDLDNRISAGGALVYDTASRKLLYSKNGEAKLYPASMTKLLTAITALEYGTDGMEFTAGSELELVAKDASTAGLEAGMRFTFPMLLDMMMLPSGNDAAYVVAAAIGRASLEDDTASVQDAVAEFARMMNECARSLGAENSHFVTPDGYHDPEHYTTPIDMLLITRKAMEMPAIRKSVGQISARVKMLTGQDVTYRNSNQLLQPESPYYYPGCIGVKTGFTNEAGNCLASAAQKNGREIIVIVMNAGSDQRYTDSIALLDYGFSVTP